MSKFDDIKKLLSDTFTNFSTVLEIELRDKSSIIDYKGQSFIILNLHSGDKFTIQLHGSNTVVNGFDSTKLFNVRNSVKIGFIPIDGKKGLLGFGVSHCDFVFFDENDFCFVESKLMQVAEKKGLYLKIEKKLLSN